MSRNLRLVEVLLARVAFPLLALSGFALHFYTVWFAYRLADAGPARYVAALVTYVAPPLSEAVVAYFAWREFGSKINVYSIWVFLWIVLLLAVLLLMRLRTTLHRKLPAAPAGPDAN